MCSFARYPPSPPAAAGELAHLLTTSGSSASYVRLSPYYASLPLTIPPSLHFQAICSFVHSPPSPPATAGVLARLLTRLPANTPALLHPFPPLLVPRLVCSL
ncbi:unnamed protein product [Closterium sp. Naga37s-1]|nr:unnamed protein product [Closterium sp. Naga37s-1]